MGPKTGRKNNTYLLYAQYLSYKIISIIFLYSLKACNMHKTTYLLFIIIITSLNAFSQKSTTSNNFLENVRFGGGFNIGLGSSYSTFSISPSAIYGFSDEFSAGLGLTYVYIKNKSAYRSTTNLFGGSILVLYKPINYLQLSTELEELKINQKYNAEGFSQWQTALYLGLEYVSGNVSVGLRYDLLYDKTKNITQPSALTPVFRFYF
ncbi:MAG: hypothetical protein JEY78_01710 [Lutibacter sp.]|nr:hypothetical protein [Lutibacter sp.]